MKSKYYLSEKTPILFSTIKYKEPVKIYGKSLKKDVIVISSIAYQNYFINKFHQNIILLK